MRARMCVVLYIVFSYMNFLYVHFKSFYFLHVNQQDVPVRYVASDLISFSTPLTTSCHCAWCNQY